MSSASPVLSVLIPTCQRPDFLREALRSVVENGFTEPLEIIISDDAPDAAAQRRSEEVVAEFQASIIRYLVHPPPRNQAGNWQAAALVARGEFCFKLDDDDLVLPGFFTQAIAFLRAHPKAMSVYPAFYLQEGDYQERRAIKDEAFFNGFRNLAPGALYLRAVLVNDGGYPRNHKSTALYRRSAADEIDHYRLASEDFAFGAALALKGEVGYLPVPLFIWRRHENNHSTRMEVTWNKSQKALDGLEKIAFQGNETVTFDEWISLVKQCRKALPLYYLLASLRISTREEAVRLRKKMEQTYQQPLPHAQKIRLLFFLHRLGGNRFILFVNDLYFKNQVIRRMFQSLFCK